MNERRVIIVKTSGFPFIDEEAASWLAMETLVVSIGTGSEFYDLYLGLLAQRFFDWLNDNQESLSETRRSKLLGQVLKLDRARTNARTTMAESDAFFSEVVSPLGRAVSLIWRDGISKSVALTEQAAYGAYLHWQTDPKHEKIWPKAMSDVSVRTLERRWAQYQTVLPHIMLIYLRQSALQREQQPPLVKDLPAIGAELHKKLILGAKTRRPNLRPWDQLCFC